MMVWHWTNDITSREVYNVQVPNAMARIEPMFYIIIQLKVVIRRWSIINEGGTSGKDTISCQPEGCVSTSKGSPHVQSIWFPEHSIVIN